MSTVCKRNLFISVLLTLLSWEQSLGRSIGQNGNETLYNEPLEYLDASSPTIQQEWNSTTARVLYNNETELDELIPVEYQLKDIEETENATEKELFVSKPSFTPSFYDSTMKENTSFFTIITDDLNIEITTEGYTMMIPLLNISIPLKWNMKILAHQMKISLKS